MSRVVTTKEGLAKMKADLERMVNVDRPANSASLAHARSLGDLSENAEYHAAKERQSLIEQKIRQLQTDIANAEVIDQSKLAKGVVVFGKAVKLKDLADGAEETYTLVGPHEADFDQGMISVESPIGKGLLGKKVGDIAEIQVPAGIIKYKVLSIT